MFFEIFFEKVLQKGITLCYNEVYRNLNEEFEMKKYEAPVLEKIEFLTEAALLDGSIIDPEEGIGSGGQVEIGALPIFN